MSATAIAMPQPIHTSSPSYIENDNPSSDRTSNQAASEPTLEVSRYISRTPSPTPSENDILNGVKQETTLNVKIRRYIILAIIIVVISLIEAYHSKIINALTPVTRWLHDTRAGWLIPIVVLIALSFPPLFGHEIVAMLCGLVWGLGEGFGIVAAGTVLGEICTFYLFKYLCRARAEKAELTKISYGCLARVVRDGGLLIAIIARYSSLPGHFTTAVFATCGMPFWVFLVAAVVSLPKQLVVVYVGVALGSNDSRSDKIQKIVLAITIVITVLAMVYLRRLTAAAKPAVVYARRKARQAKLEREFEKGETGHIETI
ncbi:hypothetical protein B0H10DRAFT_1977982 [Mycena sp. CBHHK59/15]|nr:hypothetical protein B0H10DRAFT_1977982 [Mycena sp. CBHHK59/15]